MTDLRPVLRHLHVERVRPETGLLHRILAPVVSLIMGAVLGAALVMVMNLIGEALAP